MPAGQDTGPSEIKNAMDTTQADILSAYSADQGKLLHHAWQHQRSMVCRLCTVDLLANSHVTWHAGFQETTVDNVHEALHQSQSAAPLLLDVRTPQEYRSGHAAQAVNIELDALSEAVRAGTLDDWKDEGPILVICQSGKRSAQATVRLSKVFGFQQVINVKGGTSAWVAAGYPTEQGDGLTMDAPPHLL